MPATLDSLKGRWTTDDKGEDWEVTGFEIDNTVVLFSNADGEFTRMSFTQLLLHENSREARGLLAPEKRLTCSDCFCWNLWDHTETFIETAVPAFAATLYSDEYIDSILNAWKVA